MSAREESYLDRFSTHRGARRSRGSRKPTIDLLKRYLEEATKVQRTSPDLALNMEIADMVNVLKGDAPRVVCKHVLRYVSNYFGHSPRPMVALSILDACVKNCGYAFHLQISRKEFLNKLVSSFSYRPPATLSPTQLLILEMIEEWNLTLAKSAVYRDDLGNIRDMHRLLASRGYVFPKVSNSELLALSADQNNLKSAAELEREEHERQTIKMQMLLSSKNPDDLKEANRLMSILAGYQESQVDYRAKVAADLEKLRRSKELLLSSISSTSSGSGSEVFEDLAQTLKAAVPKLERLLKSEASESEDMEAHVKVTQLLSEIEGALAQYTAAVTGKPVEAPPARSISSGSAAGGASKSAAASADFGASLIDIDGDDDQNEDLLALSSLKLGSPEPVTPSPLAQPQTQSQPKPAGSDLLDIFGAPAAPATSASSAAPSVSASAPAAPAAAATPSAAASTEIWSDDSLKVAYSAEKSGVNTTTLTLTLTNPGPKKISGLETQLAQPRSLKMELGGLSLTQLEPHQAAVQKVVLIGETTPKLRWRANYNFGMDKRTASGDIKHIF